MNTEFLALAPFLLHKEPLIGFHASIDAPAGNLWASSSSSTSGRTNTVVQEASSSPLQRSSRESGVPQEQHQASVKVLQVLYDEDAEDAILVTSAGLACVYHLHIPNGATEDDSDGVTSPCYDVALDVPLSRNIQKRLAVYVATEQPKKTPPLAFLKRCTCMHSFSSSAVLVAFGDGSAEDGRIHFAGSTGHTGRGHHHNRQAGNNSSRTNDPSPRNTPAAYVTGTYTCVPHTWRFPGGGRYPITDVFWLESRAATDVPSTSGASGSGTAHPLLCVTPKGIELISVALDGAEASRGELTATRLHSYTTHVDAWCFHAQARLLWCVNQRKPNVVKPFHVSLGTPEPVCERRGAARGRAVREEGAEPRQQHVPEGEGHQRATTPSLVGAIVAGPKLQLPSSGVELFPRTARYQGSFADPAPLAQTGLFFTCRSTTHRLWGSFTLYENELYLYHVQQEMCRVVLYRYHPNTDTPSSLSSSASSIGAPYTLAAVLSLAELPSVRAYAEQYAVVMAATTGAQVDVSPTSAAASPTTVTPSLVVQVVDNVVLIHSIADQLTSAFDTAVGAGTRSCVHFPSNALDRRGRPGASSLDWKHHQTPPLAAELGADAGMREAMGRAFPQYDGINRGPTVSRADKLHGLFSGFSGGSAAAAAAVDGWGTKTSGEPRAQASTAAASLGEDTVTWLADTLPTEQTQTLMPLLTASMDLLAVSSSGRGVDPTLASSSSASSQSASPPPPRQESAYKDEAAFARSEHVSFFTGTRSRLPLRFSFPRRPQGSAPSTASTPITVRLVDVNPIALAITSSLAEPARAADRIAFLLRRSDFLRNGERHKAVIEELLLVAMRGERTRSLAQARALAARGSSVGMSAAADAPPPDLQEVTGVLEGVARHQLWVKQTKRDTSSVTTASLNDSAMQKRGLGGTPGSSSVDGIGYGPRSSVSPTRFVQRGTSSDTPLWDLLLMSREASHCEVDCRDAPSRKHHGLLSVSQRRDTSSVVYDNFSQKEVAQQLMPQLLCAAESDHATGSSCRTSPSPTESSPSTACSPSTCGLCFLPFWGLAAYPAALLGAGERVEEPVFLVLIEAYLSGVKALGERFQCTCKPCTLRVKSALEQATEQLFQLTSHLPSSSLTPALACKWVEVGCCLADSRAADNVEQHQEGDVMAPAPQRTLSAYRQAWFLHTGIRGLQALASVDTVVEAIQCCLQYQQLVTATHVLDAYMSFFIDRASCACVWHGDAQVANRPRVGWNGPVEESALAECMHVILRGAAEVVELNSLAQHMHVITRRYRQGTPEHSTSEHATWESSSGDGRMVYNPRWKAACEVYLRCFRQLGSLLLLLQPVDVDGDADGETSVDVCDACQQQIHFGAIPQDMNAFMERYNHLSQLLR